jgi:hypothetical protein
MFVSIDIGYRSSGFCVEVRADEIGYDDVLDVSGAKEENVAAILLRWIRARPYQRGAGKNIVNFLKM